MKLISIPKPYVCQYCNSGFTKENTLFVHVCEQKRRALAQHEKHVVIGFDTYNRFYKKTQNSNGEKTYAEFAKSPYYNAFVKFGSFVSNVNPIYPDRFIDWVVVSGVKLDHWCREELYEKYMLDLIKVETVETAIDRGVKHMMAWGEANNAKWNHYFLYVSLNRAAYDIKDGKISPWLILNSPNGKSMLQKMSDDQLGTISNIIDPPFWVNKFKRNPKDVAVIKEVIKELGI